MLNIFRENLDFLFFSFFSPKIIVLSPKTPAKTKEKVWKSNLHSNNSISYYTATENIQK